MFVVYFPGDVAPAEFFYDPAAAERTNWFRSCPSRHAFSSGDAKRLLNTAGLYTVLWSNDAIVSPEKPVRTVMRSRSGRTTA